MLFRLSGVLLIVGAVLGFAGQALALAQWDGFYLFSSYLITDVGVSVCDQIRDFAGPRYICSPGHDWFNNATVLSGWFVVIAGICAVVAAKRNSVAGSRIVGNLLIVAGIATSIVGIYPSDTDVRIHIAALIVEALALVSAMIGALRLNLKNPQEIPLLSSAARVLTSVMLCAMVIGALGLLVLGANHILPGLFMRLIFDVSAVWLILVGVSLWAVPSFKHTQLRKQHRAAEKRAEQGARDEAIRKAAKDLGQ